MQREYNPINDPVSNILLNSLINEGTSKFLQPVQRRIQGTHEYRHIRNSEMKWINNNCISSDIANLHFTDKIILHYF